MRWTKIAIAISLICVPVSQAIAAKKVALVIGNESYKGNQFLSPLSNTGRDAQIVAAALQRAGFDLVGGGPQVNLDIAKTTSLLVDLESMAKGADLALFYFSGHGMENNGKNYLIPIDLNDYSRTSLLFRALDANRVLDVLDNSGAVVRVMLLDACRSPFKGPGDGFESMSGIPGTIIGFAAQPKRPAFPGRSGVSPYAKALETYLRVKGLEIYDFLNEVGLAVMAETGQAQQPWVTHSSIRRPVYLNPPPSDTQSAQQPIGAVTTGISSDFIQRAYKQLDVNDYSGARATLTQGIQAEPQSALALSYRGFSWYQEGNNSKNPRDALAMFRMGLPDLDKAIQLNPILAPVRRHRGNTIIGIYKALKKTNQPTNDIIDRAIEDFNTAVKLDPMSKTNAYALGEAYLMKGSYSLAVENFKRAIERDKTYAAPYSGLCLAYRMLNDFGEAQRNAQLAAAHDDQLVSKPCLTKRAFEL